MSDWIFNPVTVKLVVLSLLLLALAQLAISLRERWLRMRAFKEKLAQERAIWHKQLEMAEINLKRAQVSPQAWSGFRKFRVEKRVAESHSVISLELRPHDRKPLPRFLAGQYLTFKFQIPGMNKPIRRCYSISDAPHLPPADLKGSSVYVQPSYRVTIKRLFGYDDQPDGLISNYIHNNIDEGDILDLMAPSGHFTLDPDEARPVVFIAGGIGVTPLYSMLRAASLGGRAHQREMWFFYGVCDFDGQIFSESLAEVAEHHDNIHLHICYSRLGLNPALEAKNQHNGRITIELLKRLLPSNNYQFMICGPDSLMKDMTSALKAWGVPEADIKQEAFASASAKSATTASDDIKAQVTFSKSETKAEWSLKAGSLLEFAESQGVPIDSGCRAGSCGACCVAIRSGQVKYLSQPDAILEDGTCLTCIAIPQSDIVLDA